MASPVPPMTDADRARIGAAVHEAEANTAGEIVTILAERSDDYADVALAWSAAVALVALVALALAPGFYLGLYDRITGHWGMVWSPGRILGLAALVAALKFGGTWLILLWRPLRLGLTPRAIRHRRVHARALAAFRIGAEAVWLADQTDRADAIRVPTLVVCGTEDRVTPPALSTSLIRMIPGAHYEPIEGAGHLGNLERPEAFNTIVGAFIRGVDSHS